MPPKEPNRHQLSNRLQFQSHTPSFLRAFKAQVSGRREADDEDAPQYENLDEDNPDWNGNGNEQEPMVDEFGREIRREPASDGRPRDAYSRETREEDEEDEDEKPQIVVLKEGKHLTEREAENERRRARGLSPLPEPEKAHSSSNTDANTSAQTNIISVSKKSKNASKSVVQIGGKMNTATKRKAPVASRAGEEEEVLGPKTKKLKTEGKDTEKKKKKAAKNLLSFGDDG